MRQRVYFGAMMVCRVLRVVGWLGVGGYALLSFYGLHRMLLGTGGVGMGTSGFTTAELLAWFIAAFANDRVLALIEEDARRALQPRP